MAGNIFAKASAAAKVEPKGKKDDAVVYTPDSDEIRQAIDDLMDAKSRAKEAEADEKAAQGICNPWCRQKWVTLFSESGTTPDNFKVKGVKTVGHFIIQSRCGNYNVTDEQFDTLKTIVGNEVAETLVEEQTSYSINTDLLNKEGVANAISTALDTLVKKGILTAAELETLIVAKAKRVLTENTLDRLASLCNKDKNKMGLMLDALGSNVPSYVK